MQSFGPERGGVGGVGRVLPVFEVCGGVGGGGRHPGAAGLVHREDVEQRRGPEVVHVDQALVPPTEVLVLTQNIAALVLALENIGVKGPMGLVIDGLLVKLQVRVLIMILGDPPPGVDGGCAVDQRTESQPDVCSGLILALASSQDSWKCE